MQLFLDYDKLILERLTTYIKTDFGETVLDVIRKLQYDWELSK
jgi:hypothetical protein